MNGLSAIVDCGTGSNVAASISVERKINNATLVSNFGYSSTPRLILDEPTGNIHKASWDLDVVKYSPFYSSAFQVHALAWTINTVDNPLASVNVLTFLGQSLLH